MKRFFACGVGLWLILSPLLAQEVALLTPEEISFITQADTATPMRVYLITNRDDSLLLRTPSQLVQADPADEALQHFLQRLYRTVTDSASMGVGIAAPQVGLLRQIIWVQRFDKEGFPFEVFLNPRIIEYSMEMQTGPEGCLSIPNERGMVSRAEKIQIEYDSPDGSHHIESVAGFTAVIFQHEIDHLNGILYKDHMVMEIADAAKPGLTPPANARWQQAVRYRMDIDMDVENHRFTGEQTLLYVNHSPDTLKRVFYHLYLNAFQPGSMMDIQYRSIEDPDRRTRSMANLSPEEIGFQRVNMLLQDGKETAFREVGTILEVELAQPIFPGDSSLLQMDFDAQVPVKIRRTGRNTAEGIDYTMTQWYPKMCEYDQDGWHANPYIGREFHGVWGDFDVTIHIDSSYVLGATGYLQNPLEIGHGYENPGEVVQRPNSSKLSWHFVAPRVHDFAWGADPDYLHLRQQIPGGPELHFFFQDGKYREGWEKLPAYTVRMFQLMAEMVGPYPYEQYSVVQGGDGGMEYAMLTMITGNRSLGSLLSVVAHEAIHSWFQQVLATNESLYAWMDEGFTSYYDNRVLDELLETNLFNPQYSSYQAYVELATSGKEEPSTTHADHFQTSYAYSRAAYYKGSVFLHQLSYVIGYRAFTKGMQRYYREWQFRHPTPRDFKRIMEKESGMELDWYFEYWINTTQQIDYGIRSVEKTADKQGTVLVLERIGKMPMPQEMLISYSDGSQELYYFPLRIMRGTKNNEYTMQPKVQEWLWVQNSLTLTLNRPIKEIEAIELDPTYRMADVNRENNVYPKKKEPLPRYGGVRVE